MTPTGSSLSGTNLTHPAQTGKEIVPVFPEHKTRASIRKNGLHVDIKVAAIGRPSSYNWDPYIPNIRPHGLLTGIRKHIESTKMMIYEDA